MSIDRNEIWTRRQLLRRMSAAGVGGLSIRNGLRLFLSGWLSAVIALAPPAISAHENDAPAERLAKIRPAPEFTLTAQDGNAFSMTDLRGKVVAVNFVFTQCTDVCPIATAKMLGLQQELGEQFGRDVFFVSVTVDPEHDTPEVLARYVNALGCDPSGWAFLTGSPAAIHDVAGNYGVFHNKRSQGAVDHNLLTSLIDREGMLRVQYMGERFDPRELLHDLRDLMAEGVSQ